MTTPDPQCMHDSGPTPTPAEDDQRPTRYLGNLTTGLARRCHQHVGMNGKNPSVYASLMHASSKASHRHSMSLWTMADSGRLTFAEVATTLRARWGGIYNAKIAARMKQPYFAHKRAAQDNHPPRPGSCPLCGQPDGTSHIMGECAALKHLHIQRHNEIGKRILHHVRRGALGSHYTIADVGSEDCMSEDYDINHKLLPQHLVPPPAETPPPDQEPPGPDEGGLDHSIDPTTPVPPSRLDIAIIHLPHDRVERATTWQQLRETTPLTAVEIGFRSDYDPEGRKYAEKMAQHRHTIARLSQHYQVDYQIWDIGHTGILPSRLKEQARRLGVVDPDKLLLDIHVASIRYANIILRERRRQEHQLLASNIHSQPAPQAANTPTDNTTRYRHVPIHRRRTKAPPR